MFLSLILKFKGGKCCVSCGNFNASLNYLDSSMNSFIFLKQFQRSNSCENQGTAQGNEHNTEITDHKVMTSAYEQYGVPMVSCFFHFHFVVISSFSVLCLGSSCCAEGG
jgi:hypothetical protein